MKLRYRTQSSIYIPEFSNDGIKWDYFDDFELKTNDKKINIIGGIANALDGEKTSSGMLYFRSEVRCNAFLGACSFYYKEEVKEFENLNV